MKKIISLILAMAMCLSLCVQTFAKENDGDCTVDRMLV